MKRSVRGPSTGLLVGFVTGSCALAMLNCAPADAASADIYGCRSPSSTENLNPSVVSTAIAGWTTPQPGLAA